MRRYLFIYVYRGVYSDRHSNRLIEASNIYEAYELFNIAVIKPSDVEIAITNIIELKGEGNE